MGYIVSFVSLPAHLLEQKWAGSLLKSFPVGGGDGGGRRRRRVAHSGVDQVSPHPHPARWGRPLDRGAAADQPPVAKLSPPPIRAPRHCSHLENRAVRPRQPRRRCPPPSASRYTLSVAFGDEGLRLDDDLANDFAASYAVAASSLLPLFAKP
uniref:Uncharacterized protein n=1 Tax=Oryza glumipatula TaxID=40148 RepID=A0A0E0AVN8_9ORYZ